MYAARQVADATTRAEQAEHDAGQAHRAEVAAIEHAHQAQGAAADEVARIRADHRQALGQLSAATNARITALEEIRDALRVRADRAEADLDTARAENKRLAEKIADATSANDDVPTDTTEPLPALQPGPRRHSHADSPSRRSNFSRTCSASSGHRRD